MHCASQCGNGARDVDEKEKHCFISLPGVPYEMKYLVRRNSKGCERIRTAVHYPQNNSYGRGEADFGAD
jgi:hypothetical protein